MGYCTLTQLKEILKIDADDTSSDDELAGCIKSADAKIDNKLAEVDLTVPSTTPQSIIDASSHYAAWIFRRRLDPTGAEAFKAEAEEFLQDYINAEKTDPGFRVVQA